MNRGGLSGCERRAPFGHQAGFELPQQILQFGELGAADTAGERNDMIGRTVHRNRSMLLGRNRSRALPPPWPAS